MKLCKLTIGRAAYSQGNLGKDCGPGNVLYCQKCVFGGDHRVKEGMENWAGIWALGRGLRQYQGVQQRGSVNSCADKRVAKDRGWVREEMGVSTATPSAGAGPVCQSPLLVHLTA